MIMPHPCCKCPCHGHTDHTGRYVQAGYDAELAAIEAEEALDEAFDDGFERGQNTGFAAAIKMLMDA